MMNPTEFGQRILAWFDRHGRKQLPWKENPTAYRVWVSEIMLQQTQVKTVIGYYQRFMTRFPTIEALAVAPLDEVLVLWAGLGYYARARHLHQTARIVRERCNGDLPLDLMELQRLPGIGRSTAGAILALATGQRHPILDGNVKRLLARFAAVEGWPGQAAVLTLLWELAERYTPCERVADYTQAMMDLGALVCTVRRPQCSECPLAVSCIAHQRQQETAFPTPKPRRELPVRAIRMLLLRSACGKVLLEHRPPVGIWGGLWSLPECPLEADIGYWCQERLGLTVKIGSPWTVLRHSFSHFHLDITPVPAGVTGTSGQIMEGKEFVWYNLHSTEQYGLAAPVRGLLAALTSDF
jgi:A/G-specific adenine glycosylase